MFVHLQIELDKTAEDFRKAHQERQELIRQWENTIEQMQRRDKEMDLLAAVSVHWSNWKGNKMFVCVLRNHAFVPGFDQTKTQKLK